MECDLHIRFETTSFQIILKANNLKDGTCRLLRGDWSLVSSDMQTCETGQIIGCWCCWDSGLRCDFRHGPLAMLSARTGCHDTEHCGISSKGRWHLCWALHSVSNEPKGERRGPGCSREKAESMSPIIRNNIHYLSCTECFAHVSACASQV